MQGAIKCSAKTLIACLTFAGIGAGPPPDEQPQAHVIAGHRFRIICDWKDQKAAAEALHVAEAVWPVVAEAWGCENSFAKSGGPVRELDICLYQTIAAYESADAARTGGRFRDNLSFSHHEDRKAHVALQPPCSEELLARIGLPVLTRTMLAHEAAHLVVYSLVPNHADHPEWMTEGFAAWTATQVLLADRSIASVETDPFSATMLTRARSLASDDRCPSLKAIITGAKLSLNLQDRYALYWQLYRFLNQPKYEAKLRAIHCHARQLPRSDRFALELGNFAVEQFGGASGLKTCDAEFRRFLIAARPRWCEMARSMEERGDEWIQIAFPSNQAILQFDLPIPKASFRVAGSFELLRNQGKCGASAIAFHTNSDSSIEIRFSTDHAVQIAAVDRPSGRIRVLAKDRSGDSTDGLLVMGPHRFSIDIGRDGIAIAVDGRPPLRTVFPAGESVSRWGLKTEPGTAVIWREITWSSNVSAGADR